jgi:hypothetical protein
MRHVLVEVVWLDNSGQEMELISNQRPCSFQTARCEMLSRGYMCWIDNDMYFNSRNIVSTGVLTCISIHKIIVGRDEQNPRKAPEFTASHFE